MLSKQEWRYESERAAAHKFGEKHMGWYVFRRYGAAPTAVAVVAVALGAGAYWVWNKAGDMLSGASRPSGAPHLFWFVAAALALATFAAFRSPSSATIFLVKAATAAILWLAVISYGVAAYLF